MQRETGTGPYRLATVRPEARSVARTSLPGNPLAASAARRFVRAALADWTELGLPAAAGITDRLADDAAILVSELVTNAVVHAGTTVELLCRLEAQVDQDPAALVIEVSDHHPSRVVRTDPPASNRGIPEYGHGLQLVAVLSACWGITYRSGLKTVWARLPVEPDASHLWLADADADGQALQRSLRVAEILAPAPRRTARDPDRDWINRGALTFLAEASDLLAGQLDEDMVAALAGQLLVPRLADWCAVWLTDPGSRGADGTPGAALRLARVWHASESSIEELRTALEKDPPRLPEPACSGPLPLPWPSGARGGTADADGAALAYPLVVGGRALGTLLLGRAGLTSMPDEVTGLIEDFARRVALAISAARRYTRQATISRVLQRGLLPSRVAEIPGVESALVYEPTGEGLAGGDFYDVFPGVDGRWCFALGDVQGNGPEAAVVAGLARPWLRLLAREGYQVSDVLDRLNRLLLDDAPEAVEAAARAVTGAPAYDGGQARFLSLLYGELVPVPPERGGGVHCTLSSAGHPLPLLLRPDGSVLTRPAAAAPQMLLGVVEDASYESETFGLAPGDTLLCVTDGITERRSGQRQFDDGDGLAAALAGCVGLSAAGIAERIRRTVHEFAQTPPDDDLALLVLQAR